MQRRTTRRGPEPDGRSVGQAQRGGHRLDRDARLDVQLQRLAAGRARRRGVAARRPAPRRRATAATSSSKSGWARRDRRAGVHEQHVAVEGGEVDQRAVEGVALRAGGPRLLPPLEVASSRRRCRAPAAAVPLPVPPAPSATCSASVSPASSSADSAAASASAARTRWSAASRQASSEVSDAGMASTVGRGARARRRRGPAAATVRRAPARPRPPSAAPSSASRRARSTSATASGGGVRSVTSRHRERIVTDTSSGCRRRRAQQEHRARRRLLDRLEQRVGRLLGEPVGVLDQDDLPAAECGAPGRRARPPRASRPREIDSPSGTTAWTSGWLRRQHGVAGRALAAAGLAVRSHCSAAANARAATDRPEPAGPVNSQACVIAPVRARPAVGRIGGRPRGRPQHVDRVVLPDQVVPHGHAVAVAHALREDADGRISVQSVRRGGSRAARRPRAPAGRNSSGGRDASSTR